MDFWRGQPYEVDCSLIAETTIGEVKYGQHHITEDTLLAEPQQMWTTDVYTCSEEESRSPFKASLLIPVTRESGFSALATWFHADFGQGIILTNAPDAPKTHWGRFVYPLNRAIKLEKGIDILVEFFCGPTTAGHCQSKWSVKVGDGAWEHHQSIN